MDEKIIRGNLDRSQTIDLILTILFSFILTIVFINRTGFLVVLLFVIIWISISALMFVRRHFYYKVDSEYLNVYKPWYSEPVDKYKLDEIDDIRIEITKIGGYWRIYIDGKYYLSLHFKKKDFKELYDLLKSKKVNVVWNDLVM